MITDGTTNWHYLTIKNISELLRGILCLNCFHSYTTKIKLKKHEGVSKDHDFCDIIMPDEDNKILKHDPGEHSLKVPFIIYGDLNV